MLIRINGGAGGIKEYLEDGQKQDRFYSRDELDERVIIDGNLSVTDTIIESMDNDNNKYFHITLAFKEDYVSHEVLADINQEFKEYFLSGYKDGEINYYAEAHLPRIKSYMPLNNNNLIERKPHIHVVIPRINLLDGSSFNPSIPGMIKYINAFQEHINTKYGLASPKDNLRTNFNNSSEVISRHKGDIFNTNGKEQKAAMLDLILNNNPTNINELKILLIKNGYAVKLRNKDDPTTCYLNIKLPDNIKGINLKESVFRSEFLCLSREAKLAKLNQNKTDKYIMASIPKQSLTLHNQLMQKWRELKSLETRFINRNISKKERQVYYKLSPEDKLSYLNGKHQKYYEQYAPLVESNSDEQTVQASPENNIDTINFNEQHVIKDSLVTELIQQNQEQDKQHTFRNRLHELNSKLHADILLELTEKTHGIQPEQYFITKDKNGADRIKCGRRNLSIVDFCLKELNLPFKDTISLLDNAYNMQNDLTRERGGNIHQGLYLKEQYREWFTRYKIDRVKQLNTTLSDASNTRKHIIVDTKYQIKVIRNNQQLPPAQRIKQVNLLKARHVFELDALSKARKQQQNSIRKAFNLEMQASYRKFLTEQAKLGDETALQELRRLRIKFDKTDGNQNNTFKYVDRYQEFRLNITYDIDNNGTICYKLDDQVIIKDSGRKLEVIKDTQDNIKLSLDLAITKFGKSIELTGTPEFKQKIIEMAVKNNYKVEFLDEYSRLYYAKTLNAAEIDTNTISR